MMVTSKLLKISISCIMKSVTKQSHDWFYKYFVKLMCKLGVTRQLAHIKNEKFQSP